MSAYISIGGKMVRLRAKRKTKADKKRDADYNYLLILSMKSEIERITRDGAEKERQARAAGRRYNTQAEAQKRVAKKRELRKRIRELEEG